MDSVGPGVVDFTISRMPFLSDVTKGELIRLMKDGSTVNDAAETLGISRKTVARWWKRYEEEGERGLRSRRGQSGRKKKTTADQDEAMVEVSISIYRIKFCRLLKFMSFLATL